MSRLVIVGGDDGGILAGLRAREVAPSVEPLLVMADTFTLAAALASQPSVAVIIGGRLHRGWRWPKRSPPAACRSPATAMAAR